MIIFSIIIITYNRADIISETIESVLNQTYKQFEIIIIDDGSTDNTKDIINSYRNDTIKYHKIKKSGKLSVLRNYGMKMASGDVITFLDSDDILHPEKLQSAYNIFSQKKDLNIIIHNLSTFENSKVIKASIYPYKHSFQENILKRLLLNKFSPYSSYLFKTSILEQVGLMDEQFPDGQLDFLSRLVSYNQVYYDPKVLISLRRHSNNMSKSKNDVTSFKEYIITLNKLIKNGLISEKFFNERIANTHYKIASLMRKGKEYTNINHHLNLCIKSKPFSKESFKSIFILFYYSLARVFY